MNAIIPVSTMIALTRSMDGTIDVHPVYKHQGCCRAVIGKSEEAERSCLYPVHPKSSLRLGAAMKR